MNYNLCMLLFYYYVAWVYAMYFLVKSVGDVKMKWILMVLEIWNFNLIYTEVSLSRFCELKILVLILCT